MSNAPPDEEMALAETPLSVPPTPPRRALKILRALWPPLVLGLVGWFGWHDLRGLDLHALHGVVSRLSDADLVGLQLLAAIPVLAMCGYDLLLNRWLGINLPIRRVLRYAWPACTLANLVGLSGMDGENCGFQNHGASHFRRIRIKLSAAEIAAQAAIR